MLPVQVLWDVMMARQACSSADRGATRYRRARTRQLENTPEKVTFADAAGAGEEEEDLQAPGGVSYTHLTLPTRCSV